MSKIKCEQEHFEFLIACACRYNIGRMTYSPHEFICIVRKHIDSLTPQCIRWILDDIERAEPDGLGMEIDKVEWTKLKSELIEKLNKEAQNARYN